MTCWSPGCDPKDTECHQLNQTWIRILCSWAHDAGGHSLSQGIQRKTTVFIGHPYHVATAYAVFTLLLSCKRQVTVLRSW